MITVVGSSNTDFTIKVDKFPSLGETVLGKEFFVCGGGKGANQAACIARLGGKVNFISNIGLDQFGPARIKDLNRLGVDTRFVKKDRLHASGVAFILVDKEGRNLITVSPGSNNFLRVTDIIKRSSRIREAGILLLQLEIPLEAVTAALHLAKRYRKMTILNPAPAHRLVTYLRGKSGKNILSKVDILVPNESELALLSKRAPRDKTALIKAANLLLQAGVGCVIITRGKKGSLLVTKKKARFFKANRVKAVDTTCAGDAFCGALALGLDKGKSIEDAIGLANKVAALTTTKLGAQSSLPTLQEVRKLFGR